MAKKNSSTCQVDTAVRANDIDEAAALAAKAEAERSLKDRGAKMDYAEAQVKLAEAMAQLRSIDRMRKGKGH